MNKSCTIIATLIQFAEIIQSIISLIGKMLVLWWQSNFLFLQVAPTGTDTSYALSLHAGNNQWILPSSIFSWRRARTDIWIGMKILTFTHGVVTMELENWYLNRMRISIFFSIDTQHSYSEMDLFSKLDTLKVSPEIVPPIKFLDWMKTKTEFVPVRVQVSATTFLSSN
jgi:hypothetical protein